ncbi:hypothetical protein OH146_12685 [Salinibacterium sp. SYSU T00001]|uniref:hypothetical protein n=1 Tax=Homoserinimonas sedimenticola TaxID=2986805 RepID=UPI002235717F|nr:hypothetical protein [Salinibacterium sedimenticola]MCW4386630.1 hypothetical protein [Salinibacterium sedimenticola]
MPEASRRRPEPHRVLVTLHGHVRARPHDVWAAIAARLDPGEAGRSRFLADERALLVVTQGGRWYRGEYRVVADDEGSHVVHVILDVSRSQRPLGRFSGRTVIERAPGEFERMLRQLRLELEG